MMTSSMTSQGGLEFGPLYSFINEITSFFMITKKRAKISSLNFLCISIMRLWLHLYKYIFMMSLMTSPDHKVSHILKLIFLRPYLRHTVVVAGDDIMFHILVKDIFTFRILSWIWLGPSRWNYVWNNKTYYLPNPTNIMPADALATLGVSASAGMVLTLKAGIFRLQHQNNVD